MFVLDTPYAFHSPNFFYVILFEGIKKSYSEKKWESSLFLFFFITIEVSMGWAGTKLFWPNSLFHIKDQVQAKWCHLACFLNPNTTARIMLLSEPLAFKTWWGQGLEFVLTLNMVCSFLTDLERIIRKSLKFSNK